MKIRYLITGTGHCGTGYVARLLTDAGVMCGHEHVFTMGGHLRDREPLTGESSWPAAAYLHHPILAEAFIVHLVRNPLHVIYSFGYKSTQGTGIQLVLNRVIGWNQMIEDFCARTHHKCVRVRVEERRKILEYLGIEDGGEFDDNSYNTHREDDNFPSWDELPDTLPVKTLREMAERYGYEY